MIQITMMFKKFLLMILNLKRKNKIKREVKLMLEKEFLKKYLEILIKNKASKLNVFLNLNKLNY